MYTSNIIAGNASHGIHISGSASTNNEVSGNYIGTNPYEIDGLSNGGDGVRFSDEGEGAPSGNFVGDETGSKGNHIAFNSERGVAVLAGRANRINANFIHSNGGRGITLSEAGNPTPDDDEDADTGPNDLQNSPVLTYAQSYPYFFEGTLNSKSGTEYRIEFFINLDDNHDDPDGRSEGEVFIGSLTTTTSASGEAVFSGSFDGPTSNSLFVTATATDPDGNTSEFSVPFSTTAPSKSYGNHYVLNTTYSGIPLHWVDGISDFVISETVSDAKATAVASGFATWNLLDQLNYTNRGVTTSDQWAGDVDGLNNNVWITSDWEETTGFDPGIVALARVRYNTFTGVMTDVDIAYNAEFTKWSTTQEPGTMDVMNVATHEIGHFSGLGDLYESSDQQGWVPDMGSGNMEETMYGLIPTDEIKKATLNFGDRAGIEAIYGFMARTGLDLVLVFDGSDDYVSYYEGFEDARRGSIELIDKLRVGDRIGIVMLPNTTVQSITEITDDPQVRQNLKDALSSMAPPGGSAVELGSALQVAQTQLQSVNNDFRDKQAMILFTTGEENKSPLALNSLGSILATGTEVYTIGFTNNDGRILLSDLADKTGGKFFMALDASDIPEKINRIWEYMLGWQILYQEMRSTEELVGVAAPGHLWVGGLSLRWEGGLSLRWEGGWSLRWEGGQSLRWEGGQSLRWEGGQSLRWEGGWSLRWEGGLSLRWEGGQSLRWEGAMIDGGVSTMEVGVRWQGSDLDLTLQDPDGNWVTPADAASVDSIEYVSSDTYEYYRIQNPKPGDWKPYIFGADLPTEPEPYSVYVAAYTDLTLGVSSEKDQYMVGEEVEITVNLHEGGQTQGDIDLTGGTPITDAVVVALVAAPSALDPVFIWFDHVGNGQYSMVYTDADTIGSYRFFILAERGESGDGIGAFFRSSEYTIHVTEEYAGDLVTARNTILELPDEIFKDENGTYREVFEENLAVAGHLAQQEEQYRQAVRVLNSDVLSKMDGYMGGDPEDDWIVDEETQRAIYPVVIDMISALTEMFASMEEQITAIIEGIQDLDNSVFSGKADLQKKTLTQKMRAVQAQIDAEEYGAAINKLRNDVLKKMDGYLGGESIDDWIIVQEAQELIVPMIEELIKTLEDTMGEGSGLLIPDEEEVRIFSVSQNYPNPFNMETTIRYTLPGTRDVKLNIYDVRGRLVKTLLDLNQGAGTYTVRWDGRDRAGFVVGSGIYIYRFQAGNDIITRKLTILK